MPMLHLLQMQLWTCANKMDIKKYLTSPDIFETAELLTSAIPFSEAVVQACRENRCGQYGTCWTCPPGVGTLESLKNKALSFEKAVLFTCKYNLEDCFDFEGMQDAAKKSRELLFSIADKLRADGVRFQAMGCGSCDLCDKCTYPDAPCRFPERALISMEACGINVIELAKNVGVRYNNGSETVTYFSIILYD